VLAGVETAPATRQVVVAGAEPSTFRASPLLGAAGHMDADLAVAEVFETKLDLGDGPCGFDAEDSLVKVFVSHTRDNRVTPQRLSTQGCHRAPLFS